MLNLRSIAFGCVLLGIFFRFANIGGKLFWMDEVFTALRVSGYTMSEMRTDLLDGELIREEQLKKFQFRNEDRGPRDVVRGLALEDSHHPPLYFLSLRTWQGWAGNTVSSARYFSAVVSLLLLPGLIWLCRELVPDIKNDSFAAMAVAFAAVSPTHVVFAQQARPYALWAVLIVASSAALLRALRCSTSGCWALYSLLIIASLYTHVLSMGVAFAHLVIVVSCHRKSRRNLFAFFAAGVCALAVYSPWLWAIATAPPVQGFGMDVQQRLPGIAQVASQWGGVICRIIVDLGVNPASPASMKLALIPLLLPIATLIAYSLYQTLRQAPIELRLLGGGIIVPFCVVFLVSHLMFGRHVATTRHLMPVLIMVEIAVAYALWLGVNLEHRRWSRFARLVTAGALGLGVLSCSLRLPSVLWWDQIPLDNALAPAIVENISAADRPLVISDAERVRTKLMFLHTISVRLPDNIVYQLVPPDKQPSPRRDFRDIFMIDPTEELLAKGRSAYGRDAIQLNEKLWAWKWTEVN